MLIAEAAEEELELVEGDPAVAVSVQELEDLDDVIFGDAGVGKLRFERERWRVVGWDYAFGCFLVVGRGGRRVRRGDAERVGLFG